MDQSVKITVYIASYNYGHFLKDAVESVLRQTCANWELILVNDNSSDETADVMALYAGDEQVSVFTTDGIGLPSVANLALKHARGEYFIRLDGDDIFDENILLVLSNYLDQNPDTALVFPDYYLVDDNGDIFMSERRSKVFDENHLFDIPAHGACTMIKKSVLQELGGYRTDLGAQDGFDLWSKVIEKYKCGNVNLPLFYYRRHGKNLTTNKTRIFNARRAIKKDFSKLKGVFDHKKIAVIPCRKYYDFENDIWNKEISTGKSLLSIAINKCLEEDLFDLVVVCSDVDAVRVTINKFQDERIIFVPRETEITLRSKSIVLTLEKVVQHLQLTYDDIITLCYLQSPFSEADSLEEAMHTLIINDADSAFAIKEITDTVYKRTANGLLPIKESNTLKADYNQLFTDARTAIATKVKNIKKGSLTGSKIVHFVVPEKETFFIDSKNDFEVASFLANK